MKEKDKKPRIRRANSEKTMKDNIMGGKSEQTLEGERVGARSNMSERPNLCRTHGLDADSRPSTRCDRRHEHQRGLSHMRGAGEASKGEGRGERTEDSRKKGRKRRQKTEQ